MGHGVTRWVAVAVAAAIGCAAGCAQQANAISADRCEQTLDFTCPTTDGAGTQRWVMVLEQVGEEHIVGTGTVQLDHPQGTCRSTYDLDLHQL